jgi:hypothetical protein
MTNTFREGDVVVNFGIVAIVSEVREYGLILRAKNIGKWMADPALCRVATDEEIIQRLGA